MRKQTHSSTIQIEENTDAVRDLEIKTNAKNLGVGTERKEKVKLGKEI
jgi:hypothetical protein